MSEGYVIRCVDDIRKFCAITWMPIFRTCFPCLCTSRGRNSDHYFERSWEPVCIYVIIIIQMNVEQSIFCNLEEP